MQRNQANSEALPFQETDHNRCLEIKHPELPSPCSGVKRPRRKTGRRGLAPRHEQDLRDGWVGLEDRGLDTGPNLDKLDSVVTGEKNDGAGPEEHQYIIHHCQSPSTTRGGPETRVPASATRESPPRAIANQTLPRPKQPLQHRQQPNTVSSRTTRQDAIHTPPSVAASPSLPQGRHGRARRLGSTARPTSVRDPVWRPAPTAARGASSRASWPNWQRQRGPICGSWHELWRQSTW